MTIPNLITTLRIILTPIFIIYLLNEQFAAALVVFIVCGVSDGLDGFLARVLKQRSTLGTYLDPIADKLILVSTFVVLAVMEQIPIWLAVTVLSRDVLISLGVVVLQLYGMDIRIRPSILSKITTCFQFITVIGVLGSEFVSLPQVLYDSLFVLTAAATIGSGLHYMHAWFKMMGEGEE
ncbi:MAG: CDP-alcohol phosphatidyltransferase family protein [Deltaproteobacteria bacterium]|nr:CDP-alcohol phosphatidyltransferase family protein [Deltaproteobacteria bacterium]